MPSIEELLKSIFGYDTFLPLQKEIIQNILARRDTLAVMPTGGGKSLCYQLPALLFEGLTVVVSPLISLMKDQVEALTTLGVPAVYVNSSLDIDTYRANMAQVRAGEARLLYVSPETLLTEKLRDLLDSVQLDCLVIDEAHCISEWGHDFRPEYRQLAVVRRRFPRAVCLALTATATPRVRKDIQECLKFGAGSEFVHSFNRPNLLLEVVPKRGGGTARQVIEFIEQFPKQSGIIYCFSRAQVDSLAEILRQRGFSALPYHAGLEDAVRGANQDAFIHDQVDIIVATIAFGMGINKSNVRFILHHDLPKSIESYYQEIGRAGRDGLPATCRLLYSASDIAKQRRFIEEKEGQERKVAEQHLRAMADYAESQMCRRVPLLAYFDERYTQPDCGMCDNCRRPVTEQPVDMTIPAQKLLSCVHRTGSRFGLEHVVDVLLGSKKKRVLELGHDSLSTFGIGAELSRDAWKHLAGQLLARGLLHKGESQYSTLSLTPEAYAFLKNKDIFMAYPAPPEPPRRSNILAEGEYDHGLFELLRVQRRAIADREHVPAFVVFSDRTLIEMATYYPQSLESLRAISGVGDRKLEQYGRVFLNLIGGYCQEHHLEEKLKETARLSEPAPKPPPEFQVGERTLAVCTAFNTGAEISDLAEEYEVREDTIVSHLANGAMAGLSLRPYNFLARLNLSDELSQRALQAFKELGTQYLRPVYDALGGAVSYEDLKLLRLHYFCNITII